MKDKLMPPIVLMLICAVCCGLLVWAYNITYVDTTGQITDKMKAALTEIYGEADSFTMKMNADNTVFIPEINTEISEEKSAIESVLLGENGECAFAVTSDGYSKGGLYMLIGLDSEGAVKGVSIMTIGETPGLGTKVNDQVYLSNYAEKSDVEAADGVEAITGATKSSKGLKRAVKTVLDTYNTQKEVIFGE